MPNLKTQNIQEIWDTNKKTKSKNNMNRRCLTQRLSQYLQDNPRRKFPSPKEKDAHKHTRSLQNNKYFGTPKKILQSHNNLNNKCTEERLLKAARKIAKKHIQSYQYYTLLTISGCKNKKDLGRCVTDAKKPQMSA